MCIEKLVYIYVCVHAFFKKLKVASVFKQWKFCGGIIWIHAYFFLSFPF